MKLYTSLMMVIGISTLLACSGIPSGSTDTKAEDMQITPRHLKDIAGIEWHLKIMKLEYI